MNQLSFGFMTRVLVVVLFNLSISSGVSHAGRPLALIYKGPGSCSLDQGDAGKSGYGCSEASADAAELAGFRYKYVGPKDLANDATPEQVRALFEDAKVWMQPGGVSNVAWYAMTPRLRKEIVNFVQQGGGYVGFCAGAFLATSWFGIIPASSSLFNYAAARYDVTYAFLNLNWNGVDQKVYFEGGPYFHHIAKNVEVTARTNLGTPMAIRSNFGSGRVYVSGPHPEAPPIWSEEDQISDPDGSDLHFAAHMISWAAGN